MRTGAPDVDRDGAGAAVRGRRSSCARTRTPVACEVDAGDDGGLRIVLADEQRGVAPGQSAVLYEPDAERGDRVLGRRPCARRPDPTRGGDGAGLASPP